jgi:hypothetical protein
MPGQFRPADHSKGDANTIGGYMAVHDRPAAFEGSDGFSYSVEIMTQHEPGAALPWAAFFLFVKWARIGAQTPEGHLESDYVAHGTTENEAVSHAGALSLAETSAILDALIVARAGSKPGRRWFDVMRDDVPDGEEGSA